MFARSQTAVSKPLPGDTLPIEMPKPPKAVTPPPLSGPMPVPTPVAAVSSFSARSIIGSDLTIMGQGLKIVSKGTLQVDGRIEGDVVGSEVIIGEKGHVTGVVAGENVVVRGGVSGTIRAQTVSLQSSAKVEGDVHHARLTVEQGAQLDGRVRRPQHEDELKPDFLDAAAAPPTPAS